MLEMPSGLTEFTVYFLIFASMMTSFISSAFGIGGGAILLGLLAIKLPPFALLPIHGIVQIGSNLGRAIIFFKEIKKDVLIPFIVGTILGSSIGGTFFIKIEPWILQLVVASFILWSVFGKIPAIGAKHVIFGGMFSGFFTMLFGASGTLVAGMMELDLIDELWLTVCPLMLGGINAPTPVEGKGFLSKTAPHLELLTVNQVGQEVFLNYRVKY